MSPIPVLVHTPKTAGHTMRALLHRNYPDRPNVDTIVRGVVSPSGLVRTPQSGDFDISVFVAEIRARQFELGFVASNLPYGIHEFLNRPVAYLAFLRDPVDRCISYWYFAHRERDSHPAWRTFERHRFDLDRILASPDGAVLANHQVRSITGSVQLDVDEQQVELAKRRIREDFAFVGAVERFDACLHRLGQILGWRDTTYTRLHVGDKSDPSLLPPGARERFAAANLHETQLHRWLLEMYLPAMLTDDQTPVPTLPSGHR